MYRLAYRLVGDRHEAEDLVQDAFRSAWKSRGSYRSGCSDRAWLVTILRRRAADHWRRPTIPSVSAGDGLLEGTSPLDVHGAENDPFANELSDAMQQSLKKLPAELRETLLLVVVGELTHQEAADLLSVPIGTVLSRVSRARTRLREYLMTKIEKE
jgi:RNA polymerase sigma-70 factor (ECF subfamily)